MKRIKSYIPLMGIVMLLISTKALAQTDKKGDLNGDGNVTVSDVQSLVQVVLEEEEYDSQETIDLNETDIVVEEGADLIAAIETATNGSRLVLMPGEYRIHTDNTNYGGSVTITKNLTIKGLRPNDMPVIMGSINVEADLAIEQVILDGTGNEGGHAFNFTAAGKRDYLTINNSVIKNFTRGFFYINKAVKINTITIDNCIISNIECSGGDLFDCRKGGYDMFNLTNSTIYNCSALRDVVRMDDASSAISATPNIKVDHCTFYSVGNGNANYRFFYVRFAGNKITFTNNIVSGFNNKRGFANQSSTDSDPTLDNNIYSNTVNLLSYADGNTEKITWFDTKGTEIDPLFANSTNADFTVGESKVSDKNAGDPRWIGQTQSISDINYDGKVTVSDVLALVQIILNDEGDEDKPTEEAGEAIDLGLPSGIRWASCNMGASNPEEYGGYYAWGETEEKEVYNWSTYKWCNGSYDTMTKYCPKSSYGKVDYKASLDPEDDVAHIKWGGDWRMPTQEECEELIDNCTSEWTTLNGVYGRKFTSNINGNSIFLPAAGYRWGRDLYSAGSWGYYWSSSLYGYYPYNVFYLDFYPGYASWGNNYRYYGHTVRPVR